MKKFLFVILFPFAINAQNIQNLPSLIQKCDPSIIKIYTINSQNNYERQGSGVIINSDGTGITNFHVLAGSKLDIVLSTDSVVCIGDETTLGVVSHSKTFFSFIFLKVI